MKVSARALFLVFATALCHGEATMAAAPPVVPVVEKGDEYSGPKTAPPALPKEFAFVFSLPYGIGDEFPREAEEFDRMLGLLKGAGFNTVHCPPADWRPALFKKHGMKMMVDVLAWDSPIKADIRRNEEQRAKLKKFVLENRDSEAIWGYNLWNERLDWVGDFKQFDLLLRMLRTWDPLHPVWVGTYTYYHADGYPSNPGVHGYYDYHWARGHHWHFNMLNYYRELVAKRQGTMGRWMGLDGETKLVTDGLAGAADYRPQVHFDRISKLLRERGELADGKQPVAVYSHPAKRTRDNRAQAPGQPEGAAVFPEGFPTRLEQGELLAAVFPLKDGGQAICYANHNALAWQGGLIVPTQDKANPTVISEFDQKANQWAVLGSWGDVNFPVPPAGSAVFKIKKTE